MQFGADLLREFMAVQNLTLTRMGNQVGCSHVSVHNWIHRLARPNAEQRDKIAQLTAGYVPRESWRTPEEQQAIEAIQPLLGRAPPSCDPHPSPPDTT